MSNARIKLEADMATPVMAWLSDRGLTPHGEVVMGGTPRDIGAYNADESLAVCVELKLCMSQTVIYQAAANGAFCDQSWIAVATKPRQWEQRIARPYLARLGLLRVTPAGCEVLREAGHNDVDPVNRERLIRSCKMKDPFGEAGHPTRAGIGPAQVAYDNALAYRKDHPGARWREVWENVPNHYCSPSSMSGAMNTVEGGRRMVATGPPITKGGAS